MSCVCRCLNISSISRGMSWANLMKIHINRLLFSCSILSLLSIIRSDWTLNRKWVVNVQRQRKVKVTLVVFIDLQPKASTDLFALKRNVVELFKSYRLMYKQSKQAQSCRKYWISKVFESSNEWVTSWFLVDLFNFFLKWDRLFVGQVGRWALHPRPLLITLGCSCVHLNFSLSTKNRNGSDWRRAVRSNWCAPFGETKEIIPDGLTDWFIHLPSPCLFR